MKIVRRLLMLMIAIIVMSGCGNVITEDELIGGTWLMIDGYVDGEIGGDPVCPSFEEGMEFIDEEKVYVINRKKEFDYRLRESDGGMIIVFFNPDGQMDYFQITMENENAFGLDSTVSEVRNCYFERKE